MDFSKEARSKAAQAAYAPPKLDIFIARKVKAVLDATEGKPDIEILLALGAVATGARQDWLAEIEYQRPGLLGKYRKPE